MKKTQINKLAVGALALSIVFSTAGVTLANDRASTTPKRNEIIKDARGDLKTLRASTTDAIKKHQAERRALVASSTAALKAKREATKIEIKTRLDAKRQQNVVKVIENRVRAHEQHVMKLKDRVTRLNAIASSTSASGKDVAEATELLSSASLHLTLATTKLVEIKASASTTANSSNPGTALQTVHKLFEVVNTEIKEAHFDIRDAIKSLKGLSIKVNLNSNATATTTASTTN